MKCGLTNEEYMDRLEALEKWHDWYAWHPVILTNGQVAWLETVRRRHSELYTHLKWVYAEAEHE